MKAKALSGTLLAVSVALAPMASAQEAVEPAPAPAPEAAATTGDARLDINSADVAALDALPSFARFEAEAVVQYRERNGPFASIDDLKSVPGVSARTIENVRGELAVGTGSEPRRFEGRP